MSLPICDVCKGTGELHDPVDGRTKECYACDGKGFTEQRDVFGNKRYIPDPSDLLVITENCPECGGRGCKACYNTGIIKRYAEQPTLSRYDDYETEADLD